ncbi:murein biosynthesis integral membrane protein MurJ [Albimonas sp. CAU 1670]|uniref:murein biosynthesis integral membrane protein MurJ n=1 Tax=Albimonas sp. CAU 1670 TaxID=3032599 RepID=UPI0023DCE7EF|nr:murein biosynthesis integral membrane protein MurJ [Albimonas sp. CAU 1670]MDF2231067.1 murein biosynthesis integral membrane protein MurJ [Albimonas sp. CAU 1670]
MRSFATVGGWTMASRILGLVRDVMIAAALGAGPAAEAFVAAFTLPNLFRRFFAEGAFNTAFIPMFARRYESEGAQAARDFAEQAMAALTTALLLVTALAQVTMPFLVFALASGFAEDQRFDLTVEYGRITFPYILFISLAALFSGVLNSVGRFAAAAAAPTLLNVILIGAMFGAQAGWLEGLEGPNDPPGYAEGLCASWGAALAGVAQLALVWRAAARAGMPLRLRLPRLTPEVKRLAIIAFPAALAGGVMQINLVVGRQVASFFDGAVAWLYYADRLYQLPLGVIGVAIGVVLLPELSRRLSAGDETGAREAMGRSTEFALALTLPATAALVAVPWPLASVLFGRGAFEAEDVAATALAVAIYGAGLPAFVLQKIAQPMFFAREDTQTPFRYALVGLGVNAAFAIGLAPVIGFASAALATTLAAWANFFLLWRGARLRFGEEARPDARLRKRAPRILVASVLMGLACWGLAEGLAPWLEAPGLRYLALAVLVVGGIVVYAAAAIGLKGVVVGDLKAAMRRGGKR